MVVRFDIRPAVPDSRALTYKNSFNNLDLTGVVTEVFVMDSYLLDLRLGATQLKQAADVLVNPATEAININRSWLPSKFHSAIEIGFLPGVTDNVGNTASEMISDRLGRPMKSGEGVYSSRVFFISGQGLTATDLKAVSLSLHNPLIQRAVVKSRLDYQKSKGFGRIPPKVVLRPKRMVTDVNLDLTDEQLVTLGKLGIKDETGRRGPLALDLRSLKSIQKYFKKLKRKPTDVELEALAQTWSEHCKHTIFANPLDELTDGLYKTYIKRATNIIRRKKGKKDFCVSVFTDNSGAIEFDRDYLLTHKVETHNTPSALDPFGGAITGIVGVNRDAMGFGLGAKPVMNTYGFCFADPRDSRALYRDKELTQKMMPPKRILQGVVAGVNAGGNCSGIPTPHGFVRFDERFRGKPLVFVGTVGLIPRSSNGRKSWQKAARPGDYIVMAGGRVGQDGIHGATFSSEVMDTSSPATAVQIGDPITQKKMSDALVKEARDRRLYTSLTDNGAGGLSCSVAEMAQESGGCLVDLNRVPLKYPGLEPWKIWISESQERMTLAIPPKKWSEFSKLMQRRGVEATIIGEFTDSGKCMVLYDGKTVMDLDLEFLQNGWPKIKQKSRPAKVSLPAVTIKSPSDFSQAITSLLKRLNIANPAFIAQQYDHEVQAGSVQKPLQGRGRVFAEASVTRPVLNSEKGVVVASGIIPSYSDIHTYNMAAAALDSAIRAAVASGADIDNLALLDNFCWCSADQPERLAQLKDAARACFDYAVRFETPFISGKDSMFNDFKGYDEAGQPIKISIPPVLLVSAVGVIPQAEKSLSLDLKSVGDLIYILGKTNAELGASEYLSWLNQSEPGVYPGLNIPQVRTLENRKLYADFYKAVQEDLVSASISVSRGGLGIALMKMAMAGQLGATIDLRKVEGTAGNDDEILFSESQGRILVSVRPENRELFEQYLAGNPVQLIGKVTPQAQAIIIGRKGKKIVNLPLQTATKAYNSTFKDF